MSRNISRFSIKIRSIYNFPSKEIKHPVYVLSKRNYSKRCDSQFGFIFDIDGVIVRGKNILPGAKEAFRLLTNEDGYFKVPSIFLTNASNCMRHEKAERLSNLLDVHVTADQVVMSHSPLLMFQEYMDAHVLVSGQGPVKEIAGCLGFNEVSSIDDLRAKYPNLDMVDHNRRLVKPSEKPFPKIDVILLLGEPVRWETNLQLIVDCLVTNGQPNRTPRCIPQPHIPVLACNMDLLWVADGPMPRFGHGCFLHCLESLYAKITGRSLVYTALIGKPSELTYRHAENVLQAEANRLNVPEVKHIYAIGLEVVILDHDCREGEPIAEGLGLFDSTGLSDNPDTDIFGANLYDRLLASRDFSRVQSAANASNARNSTRDISEPGAITCSSMLVCTGVYSHHAASAGSFCNDDGMESTDSQATPLLTDHNHRDFGGDDLTLKQPTFTVADVLTAVRRVFLLESAGNPSPWWKRGSQ